MSAASINRGARALFAGLAFLFFAGGGVCVHLAIEAEAGSRERWSEAEQIKAEELAGLRETGSYKTACIVATQVSGRSLQFVLVGILLGILGLFALRAFQQIPKSREPGEVEDNFGAPLLWP